MSEGSGTGIAETLDSGGHLTAETVTSYRARLLAPGEILALHDHADDCWQCREILAEGLDPAGLDQISALDEPGGMVVLHGHADGREFEPEGSEHIGEEALVDFVARKYDFDSEERDRITRHLSLCPECLLQVEDLRAFPDLGIVEELPVVEDPRVFRNEPDTSEDELETSRPRTWQWAAAAVVLLAAGAGVWFTVSGGSRHTSEVAPQLVSSIVDGSGVIGLTASSDVAGIGNLDAATHQLLRLSLLSGALPRGPAMLQRDAPGTLRSAAASAPEFRVVAPVGRRELSDQPVFSWSAAEGGLNYEVTVFDENLNEVARSGPVLANEWQPSQSLPRDSVLTWQVAANRRGARVVAPQPPEPPAVFQIIPAAAETAINAARAGAHPSHLVLAILYAKAGLREYASSEIEELQRRNPNSAYVASLKRSLTEGQ